MSLPAVLGCGTCWHRSALRTAAPTWRVPWLARRSRPARSPGRAVRPGRIATRGDADRDGSPRDRTEDSTLRDASVKHPKLSTSPAGTAGRHGSYKCPSAVAPSTSDIFSRDSTCAGRCPRGWRAAVRCTAQHPNGHVTALTARPRWYCWSPGEHVSTTGGASEGIPAFPGGSSAIRRAPRRPRRPPAGRPPRSARRRSLNGQLWPGSNCSHIVVLSHCRYRSCDHRRPWASRR